jgi:hypothetical protein
MAHFTGKMGDFYGEKPHFPLMALFIAKIETIIEICKSI